MKIIFSKILSKILYIFFIFLSLIIFFFSTARANTNAFSIMNIEISKPFEINFNKNNVIDEGFRKAFNELLSMIVSSKDKKKIINIKLNDIKGIIESFSVKEEKFINEIYYLNLGVSFNKKKFFNYLEMMNIFPSIPVNEKFLFIPIIIDENEKDLSVFSNNEFYRKWNETEKSFHLIEYILPTEDLEDLNLIKKNFINIEEYNFEEITKKYYLENSIIALIFRNEKNVRILSRITIKDKINLKNQSFSNIDFNNKEQIADLISKLKIIYEDYWKTSNQINTSIKLPLIIKIKSSDLKKVSNFEKALNEFDLVNKFVISKFDKDFFYYQIVFNGTPNIFLEFMEQRNYYFNTQNKNWILK